MNFDVRARLSLYCLQILFFACGVVFVGCAAREPDDPGYNKPAVSGVVSGDIHSVDDYLDAVRKENERRIRNEGDVWSNPEDF